jgi:hypothetical protein
MARMRTEPVGGLTWYLSRQNQRTMGQKQNMIVGSSHAHQKPTYFSTYTIES